jgi:hypothetical protein
VIVAACTVESRRDGVAVANAALDEKVRAPTSFRPLFIGIYNCRFWPTRGSGSMARRRRDLCRLWKDGSLPWSPTLLDTQAQRSTPIFVICTIPRESIAAAKQALAFYPKLLDLAKDGWLALK